MKQILIELTETGEVQLTNNGMSLTEIIGVCEQVKVIALASTKVAQPEIKNDDKV